MKNAIVLAPHLAAEPHPAAGHDAEEGLGAHMLGHVGLEPGEGGGGLAVHLAAPPQALVPPRARHGLLGEGVHTLQRWHIRSKYLVIVTAVKKISRNFVGSSSSAGTYHQVLQ